MGELILRLFSECPPKFFWGSLKRLLEGVRGNTWVEGVLLLEVARRGFRALIKFKSRVHSNKICLEILFTNNFIKTLIIQNYSISFPVKNLICSLSSLSF